MNVLDVPKVAALPSDPLGAIRVVLAFLLTQLLATRHATLHADYRHGVDETVTWYVRRQADDGSDEGDDVPVASLPAGTFSSLVARVALAAGIDHQTRGDATLALRQDGQTFVGRVSLSKCKQSGYWIRLYTRTASPTDADVDAEHNR